MINRVPFSRPSVDEEEIAAAADVLRSGWLTTGPQASAFEREFSAYAGVSDAVAVSSCTSGLHLALSALDVGSGDEVITTPVTFCGTVQAIEETGARVVFCDIGDDLNLDPALLPGLLTGRTRAIVPVHLAGLPCRMPEIWELARAHSVAVVEDAAHAVGAEYEDGRIGSGESDATVFSFFANKNMTTGEGGMLTSCSPRLLDRARLMSRHGVRRGSADQPAWSYQVVDRGLKCNLSDIQAAIGRIQLRKLPGMIARRAEIAKAYNERFADCDLLELPPLRACTRHAWHLYIVRLALEQLTIDRDTFTNALAARGVECSVHFIPIPLHPYYRQRFTDASGYTRAMAEFARLVSLPLYPGMTEEQINYTADCVLDVLAAHQRPARAYRTA